MTKMPYHEKVAGEIIEQLKKGSAPWIKPWEEGTGVGLPFNPVTGKRYKGINALYLMLNQNDDNRWLTYKQAQTIGAQVKKGEKGTSVQYWKFHEERIKKDEQGNKVLDKDNNPVKVHIQLERPKVFYATVFHASQIDNMPVLIQKTQDWADVDRAEHILVSSGADIYHSEADRAFYRPATDSIHLPPKSQFKTASLYYATALHELSHWSGHPSRLDRDLSHPFGSEGYAKEELRAEIASLMLGAELGIGHDPSQHTAYIKSWISILEDDPLEIFRASSDAEKIINHIFSLEQKQEITHTAPLETMDEKQNEVIDMESMESNGQSTPNSPQTIYKDEPKPSIIWLDVPYHQKDDVKSIAGLLDDGKAAIAWDKDEKKWYARAGANLEVLSPWIIQNNNKQIEDNVITEKTWLSISYKQKETAKSVIGNLEDGTSGIAWDKEKKCWYAKPGVSVEKIKAWLPQNHLVQQDSALTPQEEFKAALESMGAIVDGEHPIMDGGSHRVAMEGDKKGEKAGFYVAHLDGMPAGYIKNNRTGAELKWKSKGYVLSDEQKKAFAAIALENKKHRDINTEKRHKETALKLSQKLSLMDELTKPTPYIQSKGIGLHSGIYTDKENNLTCIPAADIDGVVWSVQYISEDGTKRFAKDSKKEGCFHVLGGMDKLSDTPAIIIAEGYATAATLKEATELPCVICAFDSGNLAPVAKAIHEKYPSTPIVIAADDDKYLEQTKGINPGKEKAFEAANAVNGIVILPIFAPGEQSLHPKKFSDFNDMAHHSSLKLAGVARQVNPKIDKIAKRHRYLVQSKKNNVVRIA